MTALTFSQLETYALHGKSNYWKEGYKYRWEYMSYAIFQANQLKAEKIIEAGTSGVPLFLDSYLFELPEHDLNVVPYKFGYEKIEIPYKFFDCFIALQVWEHLDNQSEAFREVMRISKSAILSFPYKWNHGDKRHRGINAEKIKQWTCGVEPVSIKIINQRAIYIWRF